MKILIVDDEKIMLESLEHMLCSLRPEAEIFPFSWPEDALCAARQMPVDIAFLDIEMGGMTRLKLAALLKELHPDVHIVFVTGYAEYAVRFERAKSKELLAYLIDHRGAAVTTGEAYAALFEDAESTVSGRSYFRTIVHGLKRALKEAGAEELLVRGFNSLAIVPENIDCDYFRFLQGDPVAVNEYRNDYLPAYSWAEFRNGELK